MELNKFLLFCKEKESIVEKITKASVGEERQEKDKEYLFLRKVKELIIGRRERKSEGEINKLAGITCGIGMFINYVAYWLVNQGCWKPVILESANGIKWNILLKPFSVIFEATAELEAYYLLVFASSILVIWVNSYKKKNILQMVLGMSASGLGVLQLFRSCYWLLYWPDLSVINLTGPIYLLRVYSELELRRKAEALNLKWEAEGTEEWYKELTEKGGKSVVEMITLLSENLRAMEQAKPLAESLADSSVSWVPSIVLGVMVIAGFVVLYWEQGD